MNYFSHYYFDKHPQSTVFNFGLLAPDLLRNYSKNNYSKSNVSHASVIYNKLLNTQNSSIQLQEFFNGMNTHLQRDKSFHHSIFFENVYKEIHPTIEIAFKKAEIPRFWFALHVLIEMQLDQYLINENPHLIEEFYQELNQLEIKTIEFLLASVKHQDPQKFLLSFQRFIESKFLIKYSDNRGIIYGLNRIYHQVKIQNQEWTDSQYHHLIPVLNHIAESIHRNISFIKSL